MVGLDRASLPFLLILDQRVTVSIPVLPAKALQ